LAADVPDGMITGTRGEDQVFTPTELLYRRLRPDHCAGGKIGIDAMPLPNISTMREKYTLSVDWVLLPAGGRTFEGWGVGAIPVERIPDAVHHAGIQTYTLKAVHVPIAPCYPHSEIQAFDKGKQVTRETLSPEIHLRLRQRLKVSMHLVRAASPDAGF